MRMHNVVAVTLIMAACTASPANWTGTMPAIQSNPKVLAETPNPPDTPFDVMPELVNTTKVERALEREYASLVNDGIEGRVFVWFHVNNQGKLLHIALAGTSGNARLDRAALAVAQVMRFEPAKLNGDPVAVWVKMPINFRIQ